MNISQYSYIALFVDISVCSCETRIQITCLRIIADGLQTTTWNGCIPNLLLLAVYYVLKRFFHVQCNVQKLKTGNLKFKINNKINNENA